MSAKTVTRLFESFQPKHYQLELNPDRDTMKLEGAVTITGQKTGRPSQRITFHQKGLTVVSATITKHDKKGDQTISVARISHHKGFDEVRLHTETMLYPGSYTVTMQFTGQVQAGMHGIYASNYEQDGQKKKIVSTQFESHHAREAFPSIDEPEAKATFDLILTSPEGEEVISNMPAKSQEKKDSKLVTVFETTPKMSTYLLAFVYGDMQHKEVTTENGVLVRVFATHAQPADSLDFPLEVAKRTIEFFDEYYGVPYPLPKSDHVAIPDFSSAAMENWGLVTYREPYLLVDPKTAPQSGRELVTTVITHELSHQWFGNLVTMRWWDNLWLNESFAKVMEYVAADALYPEWKVWNDFITGEGLSALRRDSIAGVQAVQTEVKHPDEIATLFDPSIVYAKGARLLNVLMRYIGEEDFRKGLKEYFETHKYGNTTGNDLWAALGNASGKDAAALMNPWLTQPGFPVVTVDQNDHNLTLTQEHFLLDPAKADKNRLWPVPLLSDSTDVPELLEARTADVSLTSSEYVRINQGANGHYIVHYANPAHRTALADLVSERNLSEPERTMLLSDSSMLARPGVQSFGDTLDILKRYHNEDSEAVWGIMAVVLGDARRFIDLDPEIEDKIKALIRTLIQSQFERLGWEEKENEPSQDTKLRATIIAYGVYAEHDAILKKALELFEAYKQDADNVPSELRAVIFGAAIRNDVDGAFEYLLNLEETTQNVDLKQELVGALTLVKDEDKIELLLSRLKDINKVRLHDLDHWLVNLLRSRYGRRKAWDWLRANWKWIEKTFEGDKSYDYFPRYAASAFNTREYLEEYKEFFEPMKEQPTLARNIIMGIEELENRVQWLERDLKAVQERL
ncbi:MAG: putative Aminopeptidase [Candidatus Saccharibacteria bacterium]|nr:putative Aminopeptidase [Candidatus Saccharibacteria bacterium]